MVRGVSIALGVGLLILWLVALSSPMAPGWLAWLDFVGAICGFVIGAAATDSATKGVKAGGPIALAVGLFVLWIIALSSPGVAWLTWWTFAFACAYALIGIAAATETEVEGRHYTPFGGGHVRPTV